MTVPFPNQPLLRAEVYTALDRIRGGASVKSVESETLDAKEDPTRRGPRGQRESGLAQDDDAARLVAAECACLGNHEGGIVLLGVDDKGTGSSAITGTSLDRSWLTRRIRELTLPPLTVSCSELIEVGERLLIIDVPRNASTEPHAVTVSRSGGQRRPRRIDTECHDMKTLAEMMAWSTERSGFDWSSQPSGRSTAEARAGAVEALRDFLIESREPDRILQAGDDDPTLLRSLQLVRPDGRLTRAGELLLCPGDRWRIEYLRRPALGAKAEIRVASSGRGLAEEMRSALEALASENRSVEVAGSGVAEGRVGLLPLGAVREALVNAVMHRDWERPDPIVIDHTGPELLVSSPGGFIGGIDEDTVLTASSTTRNRLLGDVLRSLRLAEREGTGVDRMFIEMVRLGHAPPGFEGRGEGVRVSLQGGMPVASVLRVHGSLPDTLRRSARAAVAIHLLRTRPSVSAEELAHAAQERAEDIQAFLGEAVQLGFLRRTANPRPGGIPAWRLADQHREVLGPILPYYVRPAEESIRLIGELAARQGEVRNQDVQDLLGLTAARASQLLARAARDGQITLAPGAQPTGRGTYFVPRRKPV